MSDIGIIRTYYDKEQTILKEEYFHINNQKNGYHKAYYYA